ncbi:MAG TPA: hypothetical protein VD978_20345 [Azospirillum sp.]|nr:hypothetical protein [Azospirillum sp.]
MSTALNLANEVATTPVVVAKIAAALPDADPDTRVKLLGLINTALAFHDAAAEFAPTTANDPVPQVEPAAAEVQPEPEPAPDPKPHQPAQVVTLHPVPAGLTPYPVADAVRRVVDGLPPKGRTRAEKDGWQAEVDHRLAREEAAINAAVPDTRRAGGYRGCLRQLVHRELGIKG